jgi:hypothetical protein
MTFCCGSGSADPCLWLMDSDPASYPYPDIFVIDLQEADKKLIKKVFCLLLFEATFISFSKIKSQKEVTKQ